MQANSYGVLERIEADTEVEQAVEDIRGLGYAVVDSGYSESIVDRYGEAFEKAWKTYLNSFDLELLKSVDEQHTIRCPLGYNPILLEIAMNEKIAAIAKLLTGNDYILLNQQNGVINPPFEEKYNQGIWHRDLPYQHNTFSRPIAINALYCLDDFTDQNGATLALPASHKQEAFPSDQFIRNHAVQIMARKGSFIILDCMTFHSGGINRTSTARRAINHVITVPFIRQQINLPKFLGEKFTQDPEVRKFLGYSLESLDSPKAWVESRLKRQ